MTSITPRICHAAMACGTWYEEYDVVPCQVQTIGSICGNPMSLPQPDPRRKAAEGFLIPSICLKSDAKTIQNPQCVASS